MNAGAWGKNIADYVEKVEIMDYNGKIKILDRRHLKFKYRGSNLTRYIILNLWVKLTKKSKKEIKNNIKAYLDYRRNNQDSAFANAGCIFKNPTPTDSAGRLIDLCALKGRRIGDACVSWRHANFILNRKNASASDVLKLMSLIKKKVKSKFKIDLKPEIKIWL